MIKSDHTRETPRKAWDSIKSRLFWKSVADGFLPGIPPASKVLRNVEKGKRWELHLSKKIAKLYSWMYCFPELWKYWQAIELDGRTQMVGTGCSTPVKLFSRCWAGWFSAIQQCQNFTVNSLVHTSMKTAFKLLPHALQCMRLLWSWYNRRRLPDNASSGRIV